MNHSVRALWSLGTVLALTACTPAHDNGPPLFVADGGLDIYASPYNGSPEVIRYGGRTFGFSVDGAGRLFLCLDPENPKPSFPIIAIFAPPYSGNPISIIGPAYRHFFKRPMIADAAGRFFVYREDDSTLPTRAALLEYDPPYRGGPTATIPTRWAITGLALNADDHLFIASWDSTIREYALPYTGAPLTTIHEGLHYPAAMAFDTKGDLFVANNDQFKLDASSVSEYAPPYRSAPIATIRAFTHPLSLALDSHDNLFVANNDNYHDAAGGAVVEYAPPYRGAPIATVRHRLTRRHPLTVIENILDIFSANDNAGPYEVALDTHDNLFIMNETYKQIEEYAPPYTSDEPIRTFPDGFFAFAPSTPQPKNVSPGRNDVKVRR